MIGVPEYNKRLRVCSSISQGKEAGSTEHAADIRFTDEEIAGRKLNADRVEFARTQFLLNGGLLLENAVDPGLIERLRGEFLVRYAGYLEDRPHADALEVGNKRFMVTVVLSVLNHRIIPLTKLASLKRPDIEFHSLQKGQPAESELEQLRAVRQDLDVWLKRSVS